MDQEAHERQGTMELMNTETAGPDLKTLMVNTPRTARSETESTDDTTDHDHLNMLIIGYGEFGEGIGFRIEHLCKERYHVTYAAATTDKDRESRVKTCDGFAKIKSFDEVKLTTFDVIILAVHPEVAQIYFDQNLLNPKHLEHCGCLIYPGHTPLNVNKQIRDKLVYCFQEISAYSLKNDYHSNYGLICHLKATNNREAYKLCWNFVSDLGFVPKRDHNGINKIVHANDTHWNAAWIVSLVFFALFLAYCIVRYIHFKGYDIEEKFFVSVVDKAVCWTSLHLFSMTYGATIFIFFHRLVVSKHREATPKWLSNWLDMRKELGLIAYYFLTIHALMVLSRSITDKLDEIPLFFGNVAFAGMSLVAVTSLPSIGREMSYRQWIVIQRWVGLAMLICSALHVILMGYEKWSFPETWPGGMPGITLMASAVPCLTIAGRIVILVIGWIQDLIGNK
eukprot:512761_1